MKRLALVVLLLPAGCGGDTSERAKPASAAVPVATATVAAAKRRIRADLVATFTAAKNRHYPEKPDLRAKCPRRGKAIGAVVQLQCDGELWLGDVARLPVASDPYNVAIRGHRITKVKAQTGSIDAFFNADSVHNCSGQSLRADNAGDSSAALDALAPCL